MLVEIVLAIICTIILAGLIAVVWYDLAIYRVRPEGTLSAHMRALFKKKLIVPIIGAATILGFMAGVLLGGILAHWYWSKPACPNLDCPICYEDIDYAL